MSTDERVSPIEMTAVEQREKRVEVVVEDTEIKQELSEMQVVTLSQAAKEIEDDWFVLLDVPIREPSSVPAGTANCLLHFCFLNLSIKTEMLIFSPFWLKCLTVLIHYFC